MKYLILKSFIRQKKKLRKFCFIHAWLSFYQTRSRAQCCLIYSSITGVPHLCVNIGINVQRAERHLNILLFGHSQLWFHSFSSSGFSAIWWMWMSFIQKGLSDVFELPSHRSSPFHGARIWECLARPQRAAVHPCKEPQNCLCTALEATWATPKLLKGILSAALLCWSCGEWKNPRRCWAPSPPQAAPGKLWHCPPVDDKTPKQ